jgi:hypothetical protein
MKKFAAVAALLLVVGTAPAFAWKPKFLQRHQNRPSHPQAVHPENPNLKHHVQRKPHAVPKHHV